MLLWQASNSIKGERSIQLVGEGVSGCSEMEEICTGEGAVGGRLEVAYGRVDEGTHGRGVEGAHW